MITMPDKIKFILERKRWTQSRLAKYLKISPQRLNVYYHEKNHPVAEWVKTAIDELYEKCKKQADAEKQILGGNDEGLERKL